MFRIESIKKATFSDFLIVICILITVLGVDILFINIYHSYFRSEHILNTDNEYRLVDLEVSTSSFIRNYNKVISLKSFHKELSTNSNFEYYESIIQPVDIYNFKGSKKFLNNYEEGLYINSDISTSNYQSAKQLLVNYDFTKEINIMDIMLKGVSFTEDDFYINNFSEIPVILGYEYDGVYEIGDKIDVMPQMDVFATYKVIGFLKKDSYVIVNNEVIFLDRYIVSPSLNILNNPENLGQLMYQGFLYLQKSNGIVKLSEGYGLQDFLVDLENLRLKYNIFEIAILKQSPLETNSLKMLVYGGIEMLVVLFILMLLFSIVSILSYMIIMIKSSFYTMKVYLLSGYSMKEIQRSVCLKLLTLIFIPIGLSIILITVFLYDYIKLLFCFNFILLALLYIFILTLIKIYFNSMSISNLIKGDYND